MSTNIRLDSCLSFINSQFLPGTRAEPPAAVRRFVTISRQAGSGAHSVAELLVDYLRAHAPSTPHPWTVFDRNLVETVLADHHLPKRLEKYMPEDRITEIADIMDELFGLHPSSWTLARKTSETMLRLAELGYCILIGRGAPGVTAKLPYGLHVRLIGSLERRVERMQQLENLSRKEAEELVAREDRGRHRYMQKYFHKSVDDPLLYHLIINTDFFSMEEAAQMIGSAVLQHVFAKVRATPAEPALALASA